MGKFVNLLLMPFLFVNHLYSQGVYNDCNSAIEICSGQTYTLNNIDANTTLCSDCEDDFNFCFSTENTIWIQFETNEFGGDVQVDFQNLVFEVLAGQDSELQATIIEAAIPCNSSSYTQVGNCSSNESTNFSLNATGLLPNTVYYIVVDGDNTGAGITIPAECTFDLSISGSGIDRLPSSLTFYQSTANACEEEVLEFFATPINCPLSDEFYWYINDTLVAISSDSSYYTSDIQDGDIVTVETACYSQCTEIVSTGGVPISVYSFPLNAGEDQSILLGESATLIGTTTGTNIQWTPGFSLSSTTTLSTVATPEETTTYTLSAEENGCVQYDYITVTVNDGIIVPNTFSPNGDNINDTWVILGMENYPNNLVEIYTRWGQKVFQSSSYSELKAWNGEANLGKVVEGVYYYVIDLRDGSDRLIKGYVHVIK